ncbi:MAG: choice-of-anchor J domain-containing protein, partial [Candidatus Cloacimonetes bacterium]|nr:choice-of-anchor J domain-containing protein [Candidatus Cloacimonadota bacterium]
MISPQGSAWGLWRTRLRAGLLVFVFCALVCFALYADLIQIGDGDIYNESLPFEPFMRYSYSQQLYPASQINSSGPIHQLGFEYRIVSTGFIPANSQFRIWLGYYAGTQLSSWAPVSELSLVYEGGLSEDFFSAAIPGTGWLTIPITPFDYNGTDNLLLAFEDNAWEYTSNGDDFCSHETGFPSALVFYSNTTDPDPEDPPQTGFSSKTLRSNLQLYFEADPYTPRYPYPEDTATGIYHSALTLSWQSQAQSFDLWFGTSEQQLTLLDSALPQASFTLATDLEIGVQYFWKVIAWQEGQPFESPIWNFQTGTANPPPQHLQGSYAQDHVLLEWEPPVQGEVQYYQVFRNGQPLADTVETGYQDFSFSHGQSYQYFVQAVDSQGVFSQPSNMVIVTIPPTGGDLILFDGFEGYPEFSLSFYPWQNLDLDGSPSWEWTDTDFLFNGAELAWMVFSPAACTPPVSHPVPYRGSQMLMSMNATSPPTNNWLISPRARLGDDPQLRFWACSHTTAYGLERLRVLISGTDTNPESFQPITAEPYIEVPAVWTEYSFDLSAYEGQSIYLAWQCLSWDAFALYLDDVWLTGEGGYLAQEDELV